MKRQRLQRVSTLRRKQHEMFETLTMLNGTLSEDPSPIDINDEEEEREIEIEENSRKYIPKIDLS